MIATEFSVIEQADKTKQKQLSHIKPLVCLLEENRLQVNLAVFFIV